MNPQPDRQGGLSRAEPRLDKARSRAYRTVTPAVLGLQPPETQTPSSADSMYKCQLCQAVVPPGTKSRTIVLETRQVQFPPRFQAYHFNKFDQKKEKTKREVRNDPGGIGTQIVREARVCEACALRKS